MIKKLFYRYFELVFWVAAIIALAVCNPSSATHYTLCPLKLMGITWCPGCGLGHSIAFLLHGDLRDSWHAHWLGVPALVIIVHRVYVLVRERIISRGRIMSNTQYPMSNVEV